MGGGGSKPIDYNQLLLDDKKEQSVEIDSDEKDCGKIRRLPGHTEGDLKWKLYEADEAKHSVETMYQLLEHVKEEYGDRPIYGTQLHTDDGIDRGKFVWVDYATFADEVTQLGKGFRALGIEPQENVGIYAINRAEWCYTSWASYTQSMRVVALYDTFGPEAITYIVEHAELKIICCSKDKLKNVFDVKRENGDIPLKYVVQFDPDERYNNKSETIDEADLKAAEDLGLELIGFSDVMAKGKDSECEVTPPSYDDLAFIMYTSGTTGLPKGVMLTHQNLIAAAGSAINVVSLTDKDTHISYLTLAHIFETIIQVVIISTGGKTGFFRGDFKKIVDDFEKLKPTVLIGVPRVYQKLYDRVMSNVGDACIKKYFFNKMLKESAAASISGERVQSNDKRLWVKVRTKMGLQHVRILVSGAAPLPPYLLEFLKVAIGCPVVQGYGLTETSAAATVSMPEDSTVGHCGPPLSCLEVKLVDVPTMNYLSTDKPCPRGEIWIRGACVFKGYYKNEEATAKCFPDGDGFFTTGDVGRWNLNGTLSIIDRKKNIFKLSQGEYIAAEKIEGLYNKAGSVNQLWVYGNSYKSFVVAVVVPSVEWIMDHAKGHARGAPPAPPPAGFGDPDFRAAFHKFVSDNKESITALVLADMREYEKDLKGFEKVKDILVETELDDMLQGFHVQGDTMTPSFKLKRPQLTQKYVVAVKELYTKHGHGPKDGENWGGE